MMKDVLWSEHFFSRNTICHAHLDTIIFDSLSVVAYTLDVAALSALIHKAS